MKKHWLLVLILSLVCISCVTKKKFLEAENGRLEALQKGKTLSCLLGDCQQENHSNWTEIKALKQDTLHKGEVIRNYQTMLNMNLSEQEKLNMLLEQKITDLEKREQTIRELQGIIDAQNEKVQSLLANVRNALLGFNTDELAITEKDGKVYVAMSDKLLFESGSARVDKRGKEALGKLGEVLSKQNDIDIIIEGHTDNKPISTAKFKDNWDLSVIRATSVVRILTQEYQVNPLRIQAAGRGEFIPVAENETAEGRSRNRRTEIILAPQLDMLFNLLQ
ncbi:MAG: OmpA family protein [Bacteroides sp.]|nr:OmpA family protein [Bacteroides sp.]